MNKSPASPSRVVVDGVLEQLEAAYGELADALVIQACCETAKAVRQELGAIANEEEKAARERTIVVCKKRVESARNAISKLREALGYALIVLERP